MNSKAWCLMGVVAAVAAGGCQRPATPTYVSSEAVAKLPEKVRKQIDGALEKHCGTPLRPILIGNPQADPDHLAHGAEVYRARCAACHGVTGDGNGPAAKGLWPLPRDYRQGIFKFVSVVDGQKPLRSDLMRTVRNGARGTSMPEFGLLPERDLEAVVDYVLVLTHRGELELALYTASAEEEEEITDKLAQQQADAIAKKWIVAKDKIIHPPTVEPPYTWESIEKGREAFAGANGVCYKCHDRDGSSRNLVEVGKDPWGREARPADLTSGLFHGGATAEDIYRRIYGGVKPMPAFALNYAKEPDMIWHLVHYVQYISGARRRETLVQQAGIHQRPSSVPASPAQGKTTATAGGGH